MREQPEKPRPPRPANTQRFPGYTGNSASPTRRPSDNSTL